MNNEQIQAPWSGPDWLNDALKDYYAFYTVAEVVPYLENGELKVHYPVMPPRPCDEHLRRVIQSYKQ